MEVSKIKLKDVYNCEYIAKYSSLAHKAIWLGVEKPEILIQYKDGKKLGLDVTKIHPDTNEYGWCKYPIPKECLINNTFLLDRKKAKQLAKILMKFAKTGKLINKGE